MIAAEAFVQLADELPLDRSLAFLGGGSLSRPTRPDRLMGRVRRTSQAADDVLAIWRYIAIDKGNVAAADTLVQRF